MCDVPRCGSWSMQINQLPKQNLSRLALAGAHRSRSSVAVFWPEVEEVPSVLTLGPAIFLTKFSQPGLPSKASPAHPLPAFPKLFCIRIPLGQWLLHLKKNNVSKCTSFWKERKKRMLKTGLNLPPCLNSFTSPDTDVPLNLGCM